MFILILSKQKEGLNIMGLIDKAKSKAKEIAGDLKEQENANKALANASMEEIVKMTDEGLHLGPNHFCCDIVRPFLRFTIYSLITKPSFDF